jgi:hypothetical protein
LCFAGISMTYQCDIADILAFVNFHRGLLQIPGRTARLRNQR